jgi:hypothetical protein
VRVLVNLALLAVLTALTTTVVAAQSAPASAEPDAALTTRFSSFLSDVLAGHLPTSGISDEMKTGFSPDVISQVDAAFAPLGTFQTLKFVRQDSVQGYTRYHYVAVFDKGSLALIFVLDSSGNIAGFFKDQSS